MFLRADCSILGPLLLILYINDFSLYLKNCKLIYMQTIQLMHASGTNIDVIQKKVQEDLERVEI